MNTRRRILRALVGGAVLGAAPRVALALAPTPRQTAGPFYPFELPLEHDNDLVRVAGQPRLALGEIAHVVGRVLDTEGRPVADAQVEVWQCDRHGTYHHSRDRGEMDPGFQGFGRTVSAADGGYRFRTIQPVPYGGRTPHIHFRVIAPQRRPLTTQLYVRGEPRNARDFLFTDLTAEEAARVQAEFTAFDGEDAALIARFDIVLPA